MLSCVRNAVCLAFAVTYLYLHVLVAHIRLQHTSAVEHIVVRDHQPVATYFRFSHITSNSLKLIHIPSNAVLRTPDTTDLPRLRTMFSTPFATALDCYFILYQVS